MDNGQNQRQLCSSQSSTCDSATYAWPSILLILPILLIPLIYLIIDTIQDYTVSYLPLKLFTCGEWISRFILRHFAF